MTTPRPEDGTCRIAGVRIELGKLVAVVDDGAGPFGEVRSHDCGAVMSFEPAAGSPP